MSLVTYSKIILQLFEREEATRCTQWQSSDFIPVDSGVTQGSVLGPLPFLIYINGIEKWYVVNSKMTL